MQIQLQSETKAAIDRLNAMAPRTIAQQSMRLGVDKAEPLLLILDSAIRYAKAYKARFDQPVSEDYMARDHFAGILSGARALCNFDGAAAMERGITTDSKDNGTLESLYWTACEIAGLDRDDL